MSEVLEISKRLVRCARFMENDYGIRPTEEEFQQWARDIRSIIIPQPVESPQVPTVPPAGFFPGG